MTYLDEVGRKAVHLGSAIFPITYALTDRIVMLWILAPLLALAVALELSRRWSPAVAGVIQRLFGNILRPSESATFSGATYVVLAFLLCVLFFDKQVAVTVMLFLSISDALASLVGIRFGTVRFFGGKSLAGSLAFFVSAAIIALVTLRSAPLVGIAGAAIATLIEALPPRLGKLKIDDNLCIPLVAGAAIWFLLLLPGPR